MHIQRCSGITSRLTEQESFIHDRCTGGIFTMSTVGIECLKCLDDSVEMIDFVIRRVGGYSENREAIVRTGWK